MQLALRIDDLGRLTCSISDGGASAIATSSNTAEAISCMAVAVECAAADGLGECFWQEAVGEYRWVFRRDEGALRIALMWSAGTITGWEHVFWSECEFEPFARLVREQLGRLQVPAA